MNIEGGYFEVKHANGGFNVVIVADNYEILNNTEVLESPEAVRRNIIASIKATSRPNDPIRKMNYREIVERYFASPVEREKFVLIHYVGEHAGLINSLQLEPF